MIARPAETGAAAFHRHDPARTPALRWPRIDISGQFSLGPKQARLPTDDCAPDPPVPEGVRLGHAAPAGGIPVSGIGPGFWTAVSAIFLAVSRVARWGEIRINTTLGLRSFVAEGLDLGGRRPCSRTARHRGGVDDPTRPRDCLAIG